jgi:hypothetical protein
MRILGSQNATVVAIDFTQHERHSSFVTEVHPTESVTFVFPKKICRQRFHRSEERHFVALSGTTAICTSVVSEAYTLHLRLLRETFSVSRTQSESILNSFQIVRQTASKMSLQAPIF